MKFSAKKLISAVLQRKYIFSDESDKKYHDKNLFLKKWLVKESSTVFLPPKGCYLHREPKNASSSWRIPF